MLCCRLGFLELKTQHPQGFRELWNLSNEQTQYLLKLTISKLRNKQNVFIMVMQ